MLMTPASLVFSLLATSALADQLAANPTYLGVRSNNPEQETYASPVDSAMFARISAFIAPARSVGRVTGDPEKDTVAYAPFLIGPQACRPDVTHTTTMEYIGDVR